MSISGILPMLFCSAAFVLVGYLIRRRSRLSAVVLGLIGIFLLLHSLGIVTNDRGRKMAFQHFYSLLQNFEEEDLWEHLYEEAGPQELLVAGMSSMALYRGGLRFPAYRERAEGTLRTLADWVNDDDRFPTWNQRSQWSREVFFVGQAAIILGHYQDLSKDETYAPRFQALAEYLGRNLPRSPYKMLISRTGEDLFRPADNAAALYALSLHDRYYGTEYFRLALGDWLQYVSRELTYRESRIPCSTFSETDRCRHPPNATALGLTYAYLSAVGNDLSEGVRIGYFEWRHYFKRRNLSPYTLQIRTLPRGQAAPEACDQAAYPLGCERFENAIGLWLSAEQSGWYTYARLFNGLRLRETFGQKIEYARWPVRRRLVPLTRLAIETVGLLH